MWRPNTLVRLTLTVLNQNILNLTGLLGEMWKKKTSLSQNVFDNAILTDYTGNTNFTHDLEARIH